ncbi:MAG: VanZ family protein [Saprospiraceae bacterium]|nr:VanZ family protein [Candidatus Vicinibacter affinis]MBK6571310.1 VanZ family protein [Candidatus Vicinibacter affinis]MBK6823226.1 VanZ family protein [Candidatus Vicinibacter affinis]MBK7696511.1 VanZ family protein [Candidatus Vicinibacter affinis]MBK7800593.1 VanZ family protein [Candidatus Vicinibacter affinis]
MLVHFLKIRKYSLKIAWSFTVAIVILSLIPSNSLPKLNFKDLVGIDKLGHLFFYGNACFFFLLGRSSKIYGVHLFLSTCIPLVGLGLLMELFQAAMLLGRNFDYFDMLANTLGVILAIALFRFYNSSFPENQENPKQL